MLLDLLGGGDLTLFDFGVLGGRERDATADAATLLVSAVELAEVGAALSERAELGFLGMMKSSDGGFGGADGVEQFEEGGGLAAGTTRTA